MFQSRRTPLSSYEAGSNQSQGAGTRFAKRMSKSEIVKAPHALLSSRNNAAAVRTRRWESKVNPSAVYQKAANLSQTHGDTRGEEGGTERRLGQYQSILSAALATSDPHQFAPHHDVLQSEDEVCPTVLSPAKHTGSGDKGSASGSGQGRLLSQDLPPQQTDPDLTKFDHPDGGFKHGRAEHECSPKQSVGVGPVPSSADPSDDENDVLNPAETAQIAAMQVSASPRCHLCAPERYVFFVIGLWNTWLAG